MPQVVPSEIADLRSLACGNEGVIERLAIHWEYAAAVDGAGQGVKYGNSS